METGTALPLAIFALTYYVIGAGKLPWLRLDRTGAALAGGVAMVVVGGLGERAALAAIDFPTLGLLLGMMIVAAHLRLSGALDAAGRVLLTRSRSGFGMLAMTIALAGVLAAFFINDVVCLALTPLLIEFTAIAGAPPAPFLLALATASNIGSAATITGNPQNMIVAGFAHLAYGAFAIRLAPAAAAGLVIDYAVIAWIYRKELAQVRRADAAIRPARGSPWYRAKSAAIALGVLAGFALGYRPDLVALSAGAISLFTRRVKPARVYRLIDWTMLLMFAGLFVVVAGLERTGLPHALVNAIGAARLANTAILATAVAALSNLVSNVPGVMLMRPIYPALASNHAAALIIAGASTLAGNLTLLGSIANLIVVEQARRARIEIGFGEYLRVGVPVTILTVVIGVALIAAGL
ncbi:MAG: anion transporter [Candidatus Binataceae bacterium]|nr:anion transporter [Candidatus Binataceae bacterium]